MEEKKESRILLCNIKKDMVMELNIDHDGVEYQLVSQTRHRDIQPERKTSKEDVEA